MPIAGVRDQDEPEQRVLDRADDQDDASIAPSSALNRVKTFERTICDDGPGVATAERR